MAQKQLSKMLDPGKSDNMRDLPALCVQLAPKEAPSQLSPANDRNLFSELERLRQTLPGVAPHGGTHDNAAYVDTAIQPSPKDSGVDISSPERKIDELGELSSHESSPRIVDPTLRQDTGQSQHKYANIVNIQSGSSKLLYSNAAHKGFLPCQVARSACLSVAAMKEDIATNPGSMDQGVTSEKAAVVDEAVAMEMVADRSRGDHTGHDSGNESGQDVVFVHKDGDDGGGLLDPGDIIVDHTSKTGFSIVHHSTTGCTSDLDVTSPGLYPSPVTTRQPLVSMEMPLSSVEMTSGHGCTLTQLNMSQKSTEADLQVHMAPSRNESHMALSSDDSDDDYNYCDDEDSMDTGLFGCLTENTPTFSINGTPRKGMYITPQSTPRGDSSQTPSSSRVSTPSRSNSNTAAATVQTGFMTEFEKFLQQQSGKKMKEKMPPNTGPRNLVANNASACNMNKSVSRQLLPPTGGAVNTKAPCTTSRPSISPTKKPQSDDAKQIAVQTSRMSRQTLVKPNGGRKFIKKCPQTGSVKASIPEQTVDLRVSSEEEQIDKMVDLCVSPQWKTVDPCLSSGRASTVQESESRPMCHFAKSSYHKAPKFNVKRFVKADKRVTQLRREIIKFVKTVFPDVDLPSSKRSLATVDVLLSQVLNCVLDRPHSGRQVISTSHEPMDVEIVVCKSPQACLRHLRRKICRVLQAVLPDLDLSWPFNQGSDSVDALLKEIVQCNKMVS